MNYHNPVMLAETLAHLKVVESGKYIDMTLGDGGHTLEILKKGGKVLGVEINKDALERAEARINDEGLQENFTPCLGNFRDIDTLVSSTEFTKVNGIIYDLGYSSFQLDETELGLSFRSDAPLDMRLTSDLGVTAADLVNSFSEKELTKIIFCSTKR